MGVLDIMKNMKKYQRTTLICNKYEGMIMLINLLMPMCGAGLRFLKNRYHVPKPLIKINDNPFYWDVNSIAKYV